MARRSRASLEASMITGPGSMMQRSVDGMWWIRLAEKYFNHSPYNYVLNNPIDIIDPNCKDIIILSYGEKRPDHKYGHIAMLIGNEKDGWTYYSKDGDNTGSYKNERGEEQENNSFTIAGFKSLGDFANSEHNTFKDDYDDVNSERDSNGVPKQRYEKATLFVTTKKRR